MLRLAQRNMLDDKVRLVVTLTGIVFAVVLMVIELGLFLGFTETTSGIIDHCSADLWIVSKRVPYIEVGVPFNERKLYQVKALPGVLTAERFISGWSLWHHPEGRRESVQIVGFNPRSPLAGPWNVVQGNAADLELPDAVIIDELYKEKLGVHELGQVFEMNGHRARVVAFTRGIRAFTTAPYVFTTFKRAQDYTGLPEDETLFGLVKLAPGADLEEVRREIAQKVTRVDVLTGGEFSRMTQVYWMFSTGAGVALLIAAALGLLVGFVVVAQTIYASTLERQREFGTLKAIGAPNRYLYGVIIQQAALSAAAGYALGMLISLVLIALSRRGGASIVLTWQLAAVMLLITLSMCIGAALVSIRKVTRLDPALVFKS